MKKTITLIAFALMAVSMTAQTKEEPISFDKIIEYLKVAELEINTKADESAKVFFTLEVEGEVSTLMNNIRYRLHDIEFEKDNPSTSLHIPPKSEVQEYPSEIQLLKNTEGLSTEYIFDRYNLTNKKKGADYTMRQVADMIEIDWSGLLKYDLAKAIFDKILTI